MATTQLQTNQPVQSFGADVRFRPSNFPVTRTGTGLAGQNGQETRERIRKQFAERLENGSHVHDLIHELGKEIKGRDPEKLEKTLEEEADRRKAREVEGWGDSEEIEGEELEEERGSNVPIKSEVARLRRAFDRGEKLSPSEMDRLDGVKLPEAKDLVRLNQARMDDSKGFTLSPIRALVRGL